MKQLFNISDMVRSHARLRPQDTGAMDSKRSLTFAQWHARADALAAGDIGLCGGSADRTARLIDSIGGTVLALGDQAYPAGSTDDYARCYDPVWGRFKARTRPVPGGMRRSRR